MANGSIKLQSLRLAHGAALFITASKLPVTEGPLRAETIYYVLHCLDPP